MLILLFALWIILNGRLTLEVALIGLIISALLYAFCVKFLDYSPRREWRIARRVSGMLRYALFLVGEIARSSFRVMGFILSPKYEPEPQLLSFHTRLKSDSARVTLANSITLTPGTISISMEDDLVRVHCLDKAMGEGLEDSEFERRLLRLEAKD